MANQSDTAGNAVPSTLGSSAPLGTTVSARASAINLARPSLAARLGDKGAAGYGVVVLSIHAEGSAPDEARLFFTRHQGVRGQQQMMKARTGKEFSVELPAGEYTLQIQARGFETYRTLVEVDAQRTAKVAATLMPRRTQPPTFEERLAKYGISAKEVEIGDLDVAPRTTHELNHAKGCCDGRGFRMLYADSISQMKRWIGSNDAKFGHDRPVFGALPPADLIPRLDGETDHRKLSAEQLQAITAIAREYVQGNSKAVQRYESLLDRAIKLTTRDFAKLFPLYFYRIVTIGAGATLVVGNGSAIFSCDELRIHRTGKLKPVNSVTIEIGTWKEFG